MKHRQIELSLPVLLEDERIVVIAKPSGLATIPGRAERDSVLQRLAAQLGLPASGTAESALRFVHRLDKGTSGVLLLAKDRPAQRILSEQFQNNQVKKEYLAIVAGRPEQDEGEIDAPLSASGERMIVAPTGKAARTLWKFEQRLAQFSLVRCFPQSGRTHQVRVHLKSIGLPLAIDPLYNPIPADWEPGIFLSRYKRNYRANAGEKERPLIARLTLHAEKLSFTHPDGRLIEVLCPAPRDFRATVMQLGKLGT